MPHIGEPMEASARDISCLVLGFLNCLQSVTDPRASAVGVTPPSPPQAAHLIGEKLKK